MSHPPHQEMEDEHGKHYFIEQNQDGKYAVKEADAERAASLHDTQEQAVAEAKRLNPEDHRDIGRVRNVETGGRDKWRGEGG